MRRFTPSFSFVPLVAAVILLAAPDQAEALETSGLASSPNTAIVPVPKLENDSYNWEERHADVLRVKQALDPEVVLIGDSITHFWGGEPKARQANGPKAWAAAFGNLRVLNLGFGWDRTQNVLWRLDHGELDGLKPRVVVIHIGTNNTSQTAHARQNTAAEIAEGVKAVCDRVHAKVPGAKIILMAIFPREERPDHPRRKLIAETNALLARVAGDEKAEFLDIGPKLLGADGVLSREMMPDFCHPSEKGYRIWGEALRPFVSGPLPFYDPATVPGKGNLDTAWPGFKGQWDNRQKTFAASRAADHGGVVFLGDSITEIAPLAKLFPSIHTVNRGISGDTTRGMLFRLDDNVLDLEPSAVVILGGTNDMMQPNPTAEGSAADMKAICERIHARYPSIPILVMKIMPNAKTDLAVVRAFNAAADKALAELPFVGRVDTFTPYLRADCTFDPSGFYDGVHPNAAGFELLRKALDL